MDKADNGSVSKLFFKLHAQKNTPWNIEDKQVVFNTN
jgi:hypothetical protein